MPSVSLSADRFTTQERTGQVNTAAIVRKRERECACVCVCVCVRVCACVFLLVFTFFFLVSFLHIRPFVSVLNKVCNNLKTKAV